MRRALLGFALVLASAPLGAGLILESTDALEVVTTTTAGIDYGCSWTDNTATAFTPGKSAGAISTAATTTVVAAPAGSTQRSVQNCMLRNTSSTASNSLTLQRDVSAADRTLYSVTLAPGEAVVFTGERFFRYSASGAEVTTAPDAGYNGRVYPWQKAATAKDSAGYWYLAAKDAGFPGAWVLGSPGLNGANFDCSTAGGAAVAGAHVLAAAASGNLYLTNVTIAGSQAETIQLVDLLWYNTGLTVTTTTLQAVTTAAFPARDINGSANGEGVEFALYAVAALGNAAAVATSTFNYTDQEGNTGNVGTFSAQVGWQAPATPVIGTFMPFRLAAGDRGVRALTNASGGGITLATTYTSGTMSALAYRPLVTIANNVANVPAVVTIPAPGIRLYPGTCIAALQMGSASASTLAGSYTIVER
jgi:hypothetical protein